MRQVGMPKTTKQQPEAKLKQNKQQRNICVVIFVFDFDFVFVFVCVFVFNSPGLQAKGVLDPPYHL